MVDNTQLDLGSGGNLAATKEVTHGGDTSHVAVVSLVGVSGSEGAYTIADIDGTAANGLEVDVTRVQGNVAVTIAQDVMLGTDFSNVFGTGALILAAGQDGLANTADSIANTSMQMVYNGTTWDRVREGAVAGSVLIDGTVQGDAAHDAAATGNPVLLGAQMETMADSAPGTRSSADGDATKLATSDGAIFVAGRGPQSWSYHENSSSALTDATVHAAPGAGLSLYVTDIVFSSGAATAINVFFEESTTTVLGPYYLEAVAGRGLAIHFQTPKKITANTALTVTTSAAIAHGIDVQGFIAPG